MDWYRFCRVSPFGVAAARCSATMALVLSGLASPSATLVAPRFDCVISCVSEMNCAICGDTCAGSSIRATPLTSPPLTPIARPMPLSHLGTRVRS